MADKHTSLLSLERRIRGDPGSVGLSATWQVRSPSNWMFPPGETTHSNGESFAFRLRQKPFAAKRGGLAVECSDNRGGSIRYFSGHI
jgi:hypothetical protein